MKDMHIHIKQATKDYQMLELFANKALEIGLDEVVFLDHGNRISPKHQPILNTKEDIDIYYEILKRYNGNLKINSGIEIDYSMDLDFRKKTLYLLEYGKFDWVIGSIHSLNFKEEKDYFNSIIDMLYNYPINAIGHMQLNSTYLQYQDIIKEICRLCHKKEVAIEINTSDRSRWTDEQLMFMLRLLKKYGVYYVIGSDAHSIEEIGYLIKDTELKILEMIQYL